MNKTSRAVIIVFSLILILLISPSFARASTSVDADITTNITWTAADSPYVVSTDITVENGTTLTLEPGVIVKIEPYAGININGNLVANGTEINKIYFTSMLDDSIGGDTDNNGENYISEFDYWSGINFNSGSHGNMKNTSFSYLNSINTDNSSLSFENINLSNSNRGFNIENHSNFSGSNIKISDVYMNGFAFKNNSTGIVNNAQIINMNFDGISVFNNSSATFTNTDIDNIRNDSIAIFNDSTLSMAKGNITNSWGWNEAVVVFNNSSFKTDDVKISEGGGNGVVVFNNSSLDFSKTEVSNFLSYGLDIFNGWNYNTNTINLSNTKIINNSNGIGLYNKAPIFTSIKSTIADNTLSGVQNYSGENINMENIWWGDASGPYEENINPIGLGNGVYGNVTFNPWLTGDPFKNIDPVIIIPGILGSTEKNSVWVIDPIFHVYDDLIDTLAANGYVKDKDLFTFPYDWRNSNILTAINLRYKIDEVKKICKCDKVDLVAHSMGGLVARQYIESNKYQNDVDQLIFLGTPHLGAPEDYLTWEAGESAKDFQSRFIKYIFSNEAKKNGYKNLFDYIRNRPMLSIQELLPTYDYLKDKTIGSLKTYPTGYPQNTFLENLNSNVNKLLNSGINITNLIGDYGLSTISTIRIVKSSDPILWKDGYPDGFDIPVGDNGLEFGIGDGTVPENSAKFIDKDMQVIQSSHKELPESSEKILYNKLTGKDIKLIINNYGSIPNIKMLIIKLLSPVDMIVTAPDGKRIGKDFTTGNELNEIDGAFYSGFTTDDEYVTILNPLDGEYKVETIGTGNGGEYTVATGYITDNTSVSKDFVGVTAPNQITDINVKVDNTNPTNLDTKRSVVTIDTIIEDMNNAYNLGWINKKGEFKKEFMEKVKELFKKIEKNEKKEGKKDKNGKKEKDDDKNKKDKENKDELKEEGKAILKYLEKEHNKGIINDKAYDILKADIEWVLNN